MKDCVKKLLVEDFLRIGRNECWLEDMARQGLHLTKIGRLFATFRRGEPARVRYRMDVSPQAPDDAQISLYQEAGWDYVARTGYFSVYRSPEERGAPELHTDPAQQGCSLEELERRLRRTAAACGGLILLFFAMMFPVFFWNSTPWRSLANGDLLNQIVLSLVELYILFLVLRNFLSVRDLHRHLVNGTPINHRENWRGPRRRAIAANCVLTALVVVNAALPFAQLASRKQLTLTDQSAAGLPVLRLAEVEQNPALERREGNLRDGVDWSNRLETSWTPFARLTESDERGRVPGRRWMDGSGEYTPSLQVTHYRLAFPQMAPRLLQDLMEWHIYDPADPAVLQWDTPLDEAYLTENALYARLGDQVAVVRYYGEVPTPQWVKAATGFLLAGDPRWQRGSFPPDAQPASR